MTGDIVECLNIASCYRNIREFDFIMEAVLDEVCADSKSLHLFKILFNEFQLSLCIVMKFLRKADVNLWPRIFEVFGAPIHIWKQLLDAAEFECCVNSLIIIKTFCSHSVDSLILDLCDKLITNGLYELHCQVQKFLISYGTDSSISLDISTQLKDTLQVLSSKGRIIRKYEIISNCSAEPIMWQCSLCSTSNCSHLSQYLQMCLIQMLVELKWPLLDEQDFTCIQSLMWHFTASHRTKSDEVARRFSSDKKPAILRYSSPVNFESHVLTILKYQKLASKFDDFFAYFLFSSLLFDLHGLYQIISKNILSIKFIVSLLKDIPGFQSFSLQVESKMYVK